MNLQPHYDRLLLREVRETVTKSGLYIPDSAERAYFKGEVIRVGEDCKYYKVGDIVATHLKAGTDFKDGDSTIRLITEKDVYGNIV